MLVKPKVGQNFMITRRSYGAVIQEIPVRITEMGNVWNGAPYEWITASHIDSDEWLESVLHIRPTSDEDVWIEKLVLDWGDIGEHGPAEHIPAVLGTLGVAELVG